jgi:NAD-dependent protein deacetylase/lipoamidase
VRTEEPAAVDASAACARARALLDAARGVVVLTGAGISAESGVPTFRGPGGLWRTYRAEELATPGAFSRDPRLVWEWYAWRRRLVSACHPNEGHRALARLALRRPDVRLVTQNVDDLHERAAHEGAPDGDAAAALPLKLHGSLFRDRCSRCGRVYADCAVPDGSGSGILPRCPACGAPLRPDVVWFGEALDADVVARAFAAARAGSVCLVVGTSGIVHPAASLPLATLEGGGVVVEVNQAETPLTSLAVVAVRMAAGEALPLILHDPPRGV